MTPSTSWSSTDCSHCLCPLLMSCLYGAPDDPEKIICQKRSEAIDRELARERLSLRPTHRLLLLGAGESGKSTIIKQMQLIHVTERFSEEEKEERRRDIRGNLLDAIVSILSAMSTLEPRIEFENEENKKRGEWILQNVTSDFAYPAEFYDHVRVLWKDKGVQAAFRRSNEYQLIDSAQYFLDKVDVIKDDDYLPTEQDILRCRILTRGIYELVFYINNVKFLMIDVGGQRGERRKWFLCFHDVTAIIFVTACSSYNLSLREDPSKNRLVESLDIFRAVWKNKFLQNVSIILFLNKQDIFKEKILSEDCKLEDFFPEYRNYQVPSDISKGLEHPDVVRGKYFIRDEFLNIARGEERRELHQCFPHFTCAIDTDNIKRVFEDCRKIIQWNYLVQYNLC